MDTMTPRGARLDEPPRVRDADRTSLSGLFSHLWRDISGLLRDEVALAKAEMSEKASQLGSGVAAVAAGGAVLFAGFIVRFATSSKRSLGLLSTCLFGVVGAFIGVWIAAQLGVDTHGTGMRFLAALGGSILLSLAGALLPRRERRQP